MRKEFEVDARTLTRFAGRRQECGGDRGFPELPDMTERAGRNARGLPSTPAARPRAKAPRC